MRVHLVAVCGTGMGSLAGLLASAGHDVSGSDVAFDPPMGPALEQWGIRLLHGFSAEHLEPRPDLVVVGNVCRSDNVEARAAIDGGMKVTSMVGALADLLLEGTSPLVVAGTHGKTTTTALCAWLLDRAGLEPGFLIGGLPKNFSESFRRARPSLPLAGRARRTPFVVEGDEYDTAFFEKTAKFLHYRAKVAIITSIEHDHVDIYPSWSAYLDAFVGFVERIPEHGLIVAHGADPHVVAICKHARAPVVWYGLDSDDLDQPHWLAAPLKDGGFDLFVGGSACGRAFVSLSGEHNLRNALAGLAAVCQGFHVPLHLALPALATFEGVARRQELLFDDKGIRVYDDFAHHPTAVRHTLNGLRRRHREGRLIAVYEARTATACRKLHQDAYLEAFDAADRVIFAPLGRDIGEGERLDLDALVSGLHERDIAAERATSIDAIVAALSHEARAGDTIVLLSNGAFGRIQEKLRAALS